MTSNFWKEFRDGCLSVPTSSQPLWNIFHEMIARSIASDKCHQGFTMLASRALTATEETLSAQGRQKLFLMAGTFSSSSHELFRELFASEIGIQTDSSSCLNGFLLILSHTWITFFPFLADSVYESNLKAWLRTNSRLIFRSDGEIPKRWTSERQADIKRGATLGSRSR